MRCLAAPTGERQVVGPDQRCCPLNAWWSRTLPGSGQTCWLALPCTPTCFAHRPHDGAWASVGWAGGEGIEEARNLVHYYRGRNVRRPIPVGGRDGSSTPSYPECARRSVVFFYRPQQGVAGPLDDTFRRTFPSALGVRCTHHWGGPSASIGKFLSHVGFRSVAADATRLRIQRPVGAPTHTVGRSCRAGAARVRARCRACASWHANESTFPPDRCSG